MFINAPRRCRKLNENSLEKGDGDVIALWRNYYSSAISQLTFCISNTYTSPFTINTIHRRVHWSSLTRDDLWSARKIDENYFLAFRLVLNWPNHRYLSLILGFAVTVANLLREVVSCCGFILRSVSTFWVMSLVKIYPGGAFLLLSLLHFWSLVFQPNS